MSKSGEQSVQSEGSGGTSGQDPKRQSISTLRRILEERKESIDGLTKKQLLTKVQLGDEGSNTQSAFTMAVKAWTSARMTEWLRQSSNKVSGSKQEKMDRIFAVISIDEAAAIAAEYRAVNNNSPGDGVTGMDMESYTSDEQITPKRKRADTGVGKSQNDNKGKEDDDLSVETVKVHLGSGLHRTRFGLMLSPLPSETEPDKKLVLTIGKWYTKMKELDKKFAILPWKAEDSDKAPITKLEDIPTTMGKLRNYFSRVHAKVEGGITYTDIYVKHSIPMKELKEDAEWFFKSNGMNIFDKSLQVESIAQMGFLIYSFDSLDLKLLAVVIEKEIGAQVALRFKYVNTSKYEPEKEARKKWMAAHIETAEEDRKKVARGLNRLYGHASTTFPLGIRMRLVSEFREVKGNIVNMGKHMRLRVRQANFRAMIEGLPNDDIMQLDYAPTKDSKTLREMIMNIESTEPKTPGKLFHAVGQDWKGRFTFVFLKNKGDEARMVADRIIPYLLHHYHPEILQFFDPEAVIEKEDWYWDPDKNVIVNPLSKAMDALETGDGDYSFVDTSENKEVTPVSKTAFEQLTPQELAMANMNLVIGGQCDDSVSTLGTKLRSPHRTKGGPGMIAGMVGQHVALSGASVTSSATMESRITVIESKLSKLDGMEESIVASIQSTLKNMLKQQEPPGGELAGEPNG